MSQGGGEIGRVLGGRYRLVARLGAGRFTHVFLGYDLAQSRRVVVKLLAEEVLPDEWTRAGVFASRFLEAAEESAKLSHPHLVSVRDWGESDIGVYVVSEYSEGGSLQGILDAGHLLSPSQTLMVGLEVARGLDHIHRQGLVHRDVRPSNILFDGRGRSRLADLGTSWFLTSSETSGELLARSVFSGIDSVRYASPEQAHGLAPDHKSDVYSLVLVLTEALSGRVPFESDDPEYTQMAKMSRQLDLTGQFGRLGRVLETAGRPERGERPSARELGTSLLASAETLPRPTPLPLQKTSPEIPDSAETEVVGSPGRPLDEASSPPPGDVRPSLRRLLGVALALVLLGAAGVGAYFLWDTQFGADTHPVPDLAGAKEDDFLRIESEFDWSIIRLERRQDGTVAGQVLGQEPQPGTGLEAGETITVWVSLGPELVAIPSNLAGLAAEDAEASLGAVGLSVGEITMRYDEAVIAGVVIEVDELFSEVDPGASVDLLVSLGPSPRSVPYIAAGSSLVVARELLEEARLGILEWRAYDSEVEVGRVVRVDPSPGTEVPADSIVTVVISDGPEEVLVPVLATLGVEEARLLLDEVGLCLGEVDGPLDTEVLASSPPSGAITEVGACVGLITRPEEGAEGQPEDG